MATKYTFPKFVLNKQTKALLMIILGLICFALAILVFMYWI